MVKLKVKLLNLSAGRPVAILHEKFAESSSIHVDDRVFISRNCKKIAAVVDLATGILKENEVALSTEVISFLKLKKGEIVNIELAPKPESLELIYKKLLCHELSRKEIKKIISDIVSNTLTEAEIAYFVAAVYKCGMNMKEIVAMIKEIVGHGKKLNLKGEIADKHSIGGVPGRTTPTLVSICASAGLLIPKTSSRAITSPSGTADAMETLCNVSFSIGEIKKILRKTNACLVWGGSLNLAPADDKIIHVEKLMHLDPEAQLLSSIMAKKLAVNAKYVLIDIPYGKNAKVTKKQAKILSKKFQKLGKKFRLKISCLIKEAEEPLGNGIGPALEMMDVVDVLKRKNPCYKLEQRSIELAGKLLELTGKVKRNKGIEKAIEILDSGKAYEKFKEIIKAQEGNIKNIEKIRFGKYRHKISAKRNGKIKEIKTKEINSLAKIAGCPLDKYAGLYLHFHVGDKIKKGQTILTIYAESKGELREAVKYYKRVNPVKY